MKRLIGIACITGLLATACRPVGLPVERAETTTTAAAQTSKATQPEGVEDATPQLQPTEPASLAAEIVPKVEIDLSGLDELLTRLDEVLANVDSAIQEGDEK